MPQWSIESKFYFQHKIGQRIHPYRNFGESTKKKLVCIYQILRKTSELMQFHEHFRTSDDLHNTYQFSGIVEFSCSFFVKMLEAIVTKFLLALDAFNCGLLIYAFFAVLTTNRFRFSLIFIYSNRVKVQLYVYT